MDTVKSLPKARRAGRESPPAESPKRDALTPIDEPPAMDVDAPVREPLTSGVLTPIEKQPTMDVDAPADEPPASVVVTPTHEPLTTSVVEREVELLQLGVEVPRVEALQLHSNEQEAPPLVLDAALPPQREPPADDERAPTRSTTPLSISDSQGMSPPRAASSPPEHPPRGPTLEELNREVNPLSWADQLEADTLDNIKKDMTEIEEEEREKEQRKKEKEEKEREAYLRAADEERPWQQALWGIGHARPIIPMTPPGQVLNVPPAASKLPKVWVREGEM